MSRTGTRIAAAGLLGALMTTAAALPAQARERQVQCKPGLQWYKERPRRLKTTWSSRARNRGGAVDTYQLTVKRSGTVQSKVSTSVEAEVGGGFGPISASLKTQFGAEVAKSTTAEKGESYTVLVPPRREVQVRYGVWTRRYSGLVLVRDNPEPGQPPRLWPVFPPPNCNLYIKKEVTITAATRETGFQKSKPRRYSS